MAFVGTAFFEEGLAGQFLAAFFDGQLGLGFPTGRAGGQFVEGAADLFAGGDGTGAGGLEVDEGILHFLDHQADELLGVLGLIEHGVDVGVNDVAEAAEDAHGFRVGVGVGW